MPMNTLEKSGPYTAAIVTPITAAGNSQATATPLAGNFVDIEVTTVAASTGVMLPVPKLPACVTIFNGGANTLSIYPQLGTSINGGSVNAAYSLPAGVSMTFKAPALTNWYSVGLSSATGVGTGSVTTTSVATANGFAGTVASPTTTPVITLSTSVNGIAKGNGTALATATADTDYQSPITLTTTGSSGAATFSGHALNIPNYVGSGGSGTVTTASVATANGFAGTVANPTTTPAITLTTSVTGMLKGNGTALQLAVSDADYQAPISLTTTGSSGAATFSGNVLNIPTPSGGGGSGTVTSASVATANGFAGTVANPTTTPAITITTGVTGIMKGNGTAAAAATAGTDYQAPISLTVTGSSGAATFAGNVLNIPTYTASGGPGGSSGQFQTNNGSGGFNGSTDFGFDATNLCPQWTAIADPATPAQGDAWLSTTTGGLVVQRYNGSAGQTTRPGGTFFTCGACTQLTAVGSSPTTYVSIFGAPAASIGSRTIKANTLAQLSAVRINLWGIFTTSATQASLIFRVLWGATVISQTPSFAGGVSQTNQLMQTSYPITLIFPAVGASGSVLCQGLFDMANSSGSHTGFYAGLGGTDAQAVAGTTVATNADTLIDIGIAYQAVTAGNTFQLLACTMEFIN